MVSRSHIGPLRVVPALALGFAAVLGITGCSAGQVTQTDSIPPAVNGNLAQVGPIALRDVVIAYPTMDGGYQKDDAAPLELSIVNTGAEDDELTSVSSPAAEDVKLVGDLKIPGRTALLVVVPEGESDDAEATSSGAAATSGAEPTGGETSGGETSGVETSGAETSGAGATTTGSESAAAPATSGEAAESSVTVTATVEGHTISIVLTKLRSALEVGKTVPVTFSFAKAGQVEIDLPIAAPHGPREAEPARGEGGEH